MPRICILGWGSLVHHPEGDATIGQTPLATVGTWTLNGPTLPVEYSGVSSGKRLTLVVDPEHGTANQVFTIQSARESLDDAAENLRLRESRTRRSWIGRLQKTDPIPESEPYGSVGRWLAQSEYDGVIWTAIPPNFPEEQKCPFSIEAALEYLGQLTGEYLAKAHRYIIETPDAIATELRKRVRWPELIAVHEAGHFVVSCALGRPVVRLSRIPVDDRPPNAPSVGCRYPDVNQPKPVLFACDFAGALAQLKYLPASVAAHKLPTFQASLLLPAGEHHLYSWTGWVEDLTPALQTIAVPAQMAPIFRTLTLEEIRRLERQVREFIRIEDIGRAINCTRDALMATSVITGDAITALRSEVNGHIAPVAGHTLMLAGLPV